MVKEPQKRDAGSDLASGSSMYETRADTQRIEGGAAEQDDKGEHEASVDADISSDRSADEGEGAEASAQHDAAIHESAFVGKGDGGTHAKIDLASLMELRQAFLKADDGLHLDMFLQTFGNVMGRNLTEQQLTHMFMKHVILHMLPPGCCVEIVFVLTAFFFTVYAGYF